MIKTSFIIAFCSLFFCAMADKLYAGTTGILQGIVRDTTKKPLQGVAIKVMGTVRGGITKFDGRYTIANVPAGEYIIQIRSVGYEIFTATARIIPDSVTVLHAILKEKEMKDSIVSIIPPRPPDKRTSGTLPTEDVQIGTSNFVRYRASDMQGFEGVAFSLASPFYSFDASSYNAFVESFGGSDKQTSFYRGFVCLDVEYYYTYGYIGAQLPLSHLLSSVFVGDTILPELTPTDTNGVKTLFLPGFSISGAYSLSLFKNCIVNMGLRLATERADMVIFRNAYKQYSTLAEDMNDPDSRILRVHGNSINIAPTVGVQYFIPLNEEWSDSELLSFSFSAMYNLNWYEWRNGNTTYHDIPYKLLNGWGAYLKLGFCFSNFVYE